MSGGAKPKVVIAGAGIGGLTAALSLLRRGFEVEVHEQAAELREVGAGVQISANGMLVFQELGVADRILALAARPERREVRLWNTGQAWTAFDLGAVSVQTYGHPYVTMYRPDLMAVLAEAVQAAVPGAVRLGWRASGCSQEGGRAALHFTDGTVAEGDALVGADGIHSVVRAALHGSDNAEFTGLVAWRGTIPMERLPRRLARMVSSNWVGPGRHVVQYPLRNGELMNFVGVVERDDWLEESWTTPGTHEAMRADFEGWHEDVHALISAIPQPFLWAMKLRRPLPVWSAGRITLLGDACHATLPFLAQGAVMAIEDGFILARALEAHGADVPGAFRAYEAARQERTARVVNGSADNTKRFHNPALGDPAGAQAYVEREWAEDRLRERYDWMYRYDATKVAV
jgi:2-polyprenyl-6-methoxyphenol hydroxylase-like FAD-dependent oxidoreductase